MKAKKQKTLNKQTRIKRKWKSKNIELKIGKEKASQHLNIPAFFWTVGSTNFNLKLSFHAKIERKWDGGQKMEANVFVEKRDIDIYRIFVQIIKKIF